MIYLLRHGQTDWNKIHKLQGVENVPLNETGRQMARDAHEAYKDIAFSCCYCSPLDRAKETAEIFLGDRDIPVIIDEHFKEMNFGLYEGDEGIYDNENHPLYPLFFTPETYVPSDGVEPIATLKKRGSEGIEMILKKHDVTKENILIVGHGAIFAGIIGYYKHVPLKDFWTVLLKNCELYELEV